MQQAPKVSEGSKIRNRYNQVLHLTHDTNGKVTNSRLETISEIQEVSPIPAGDNKAHTNRRAQRYSKHKTENIKDPQKKYHLETVQELWKEIVHSILRIGIIRALNESAGKGPPHGTDKTTLIIKVSKGAKIRNRYNQVPHLTQNTNGKLTNSQLDTINES